MKHTIEYNGHKVVVVGTENPVAMITSSTFGYLGAVATGQTISVCGWHDKTTGTTEIKELTKKLTAVGYVVSHGCCEECSKKHFGTLRPKTKPVQVRTTEQLLETILSRCELQVCKAHHLFEPGAFYYIATDVDDNNVTAQGETLHAVLTELNLLLDARDVQRESKEIARANTP